MVTPLPAAIAVGEVWHRRNCTDGIDRDGSPNHEFRYPVQHWWLDPDRPEDICRHHWHTSSTRPAPYWFRRRDYFDGSDGPIGPAVCALLSEPLGRPPAGPVRMISQPRTWGWLFNPITVYLAWDIPKDAAGPADPAGVQDQTKLDGPVGAVLEVTNTPWKERHLYPLALESDGTSFSSMFEKKLHVSPFLGMQYAYRLKVAANPSKQPSPQTPAQPARPGITVSIDVMDSDCVDVRSAQPNNSPIVETELALSLEAPSSDAMTTALYRNPFPTHRVSLGIHRQAMKLWRKRVPFISHPRKQ